jgi:hypothetical protein
MGTSMRLKLKGFCSQKRVPFFILAEAEGDVMRWIGASPLPPKMDNDFFSRVDQLTVAKDYRIISSGWQCPICRTSGTATFSEFWRCGSCNEYHCMGMSGGYLHGRCGKCKIDPAKLQVAETFGVKGIGAIE